jgi:RimJ/RimL family protein N-acetyltransferase
MLATSQRIEHLETDRLLLRAPTLNDADAIVRGVGEYAVARMLALVPHPYYRSDAEAWIQRARWRIVTGEALSLVIVADGEMVGSIGLHGFPAPRLGYWLGMPYWGRGIATEAAATILRYAFDRRGVRIVKSGVFVDNPASRRIQDKLGFVALGLSRVRCLARHERVTHIDTAVSRERFLEFRR